MPARASSSTNHNRSGWSGANWLVHSVGTIDTIELLGMKYADQDARASLENQPNCTAQLYEEELASAGPQVTPKFLTDIFAEVSGERGQSFSGGRITVREAILAAQKYRHRYQT